MFNKAQTQALNKEIDELYAYVDKIEYLSLDHFKTVTPPEGCEVAEFEDKIVISYKHLGLTIEIIDGILESPTDWLVYKATADELQDEDEEDYVCLVNPKTRVFRLQNQLATPCFQLYKFIIKLIKKGVYKYDKRV